jgi:hypothetical protein
MSWSVWSKSQNHDEDDELLHGELAPWPEFKLITGISTGALIALFAFLREKYDATLTEV